jgi:hypothetical protein
MVEKLTPERLEAEFSLGPDAPQVRGYGIELCSQTSGAVDPRPVPMFCCWPAAWVAGPLFCCRSRGVAVPAVWVVGRSGGAGGGTTLASYQGLHTPRASSALTRFMCVTVCRSHSGSCARSGSTWATGSPLRAQSPAGAWHQTCKVPSEGGRVSAVAGNRLAGWGSQVGVCLCAGHI